MSHLKLLSFFQFNPNFSHFSFILVLKQSKPRSLRSNCYIETFHVCFQHCALPAFHYLLLGMKIQKNILRRSFFLLHLQKVPITMASLDTEEEEDK